MSKPNLKALGLTPHPAKPKRARVPICAACGRRLRKARYVLISDGQVAMSVENYEGRRTLDLHTLTADGAEPTRGGYGDNLVCAQRCGHMLAVRLVASIPGLLALLPEQWRHR